MLETKRPLKVFLCHASSDKPVVRELYQRLVEDGVDAWLDSERLIPGQNWQVEIPNAVRDSDVVLVCLSENSINKEGYVQKEIIFALDKALEMPEGRIFLIPIRLDVCEVPQRLSSYQWVDLFSQNGYERLMLALTKRAEQIDVNPPGRSRKGWLSLQTSKSLLSKVVQVPASSFSVDKQISQPVKNPKAMTQLGKENRRNKRKYIYIIIGIIVIVVLTLSNLFQTIKSLIGVPEPNATVTITNIPVSTPTKTLTPTPTVLPSTMTDSKGVQMVLVQEGVFTMGSDNGDSDEQPAHQVLLDAYYIDKHEVTNTLYRVCVAAGKCALPTKTEKYNDPQYEQHPVVYVNWDMAKTYCEWRAARLPSEAEWEKAARGTDSRTYPWGEEIDETYANYKSGNGNTVAVGSYPKGISPYGAYDMAGNVWEWVADWYDANYYEASLMSSPFGPDISQSRVLRGGSWNVDSNFLRTTDRNWYFPNYSSYTFGFRCSRTP